MKKVLNYSRLIVLMGLIGLISCEENPDHEPVVEDSGKPGPVSNAVAYPTKGGAIVQYILPESDNLLYVRGVYNLANGKEVEVKSSFYNNYLIVEGLGDTKVHQITLYTVSRSEVSSDPVEIEFTPLPAAFWDTKETVTLNPTFGGINLKATNEARDDLAYLIMLQDTITQEWRPLATSLYSGAKDVNYSIRGYSSDSTYKFALVIRDRFENYTDTLFQDITPYFEEELDQSKFQVKILLGDAPKNEKIPNGAGLFDGQITGWPNTVFLTSADHTPGVPHLLTIDLGVTASLSRLHVWDYPEFQGGKQDTYYANGAMRIFEVYGTVSNPPAGDLDDSWTLLGTFESIKPSGLAEWVVNNDDIEAGKAGFDYEFPDAPEVRYIRFRCLKNWAEGTYIALAEVKAFGNDGNPDNN